MGTCWQCGSWSVAGHNHRKVIRQDGFLMIMRYKNYVPRWTFPCGLLQHCVVDACVCVCSVRRPMPATTVGRRGRAKLERQVPASLRSQRRTAAVDPAHFHLHLQNQSPARRAKVSHIPRLYSLYGNTNSISVVKCSMLHTFTTSCLRNGPFAWQ